MASQRDLSGIVQPGRGLAAARMAAADAMEQVRVLAGFAIVPGTLNVRLPQPLERGTSWRYIAAVEISPDWQARTGQAGYLLAHVLINGRYRGLAFQADEPNYPRDQVELVSEVHLREALGLSDGDPIAVSLRETGPPVSPVDLTR